MRRVLVLFLLYAKIVSSEINKYDVISKEELRGLPHEVYQTKLANAIYNVVERVILSAKANKTQYRVDICDSAQLVSGGTLSDLSDDEIKTRLKSYLVDTGLNITRSYCGICVKKGNYKMEPNCRVLLVEW